MLKFGDRVIAIHDIPDHGELPVGSTGTVCKIDDGSTSIGVCWDNEVTCGHTCDRTCECGHGWYADEKNIFPWDTDALPLEVELLSSLDGKTPEEYMENLERIARQSEIRAVCIQQLLGGFKMVLSNKKPVKNFGELKTANKYALC